MADVPITFDFNAWAAMFPELAAVGSPIATAAFTRSSVIFANDAGNPAAAQSTAIFTTLAYLLTAHIVFLTAPRDAAGNPAASGVVPPQVVGRISSASEGSVSVSAEWNGTGSPSEAWYLQTRYGAEFWTATSQFRMFNYIANPTVVFTGLWPLLSTYRGR